MITMTNDLDLTRLPTAQASGMSPHYYTDLEIFNREKQASRSCWIGIGRADRVGPGPSYLADVVADVPILITRSHDGVLRGFANTCRHRGSKIMDEGSGPCRRLSCPFHGWTYDLDGQLLSVGHMDEAEDFSKADNGLTPITVAERFGFLFVNILSDAGSIDDWLQDFGPIHAPWNLSSMVSVRRKTFEIRCNWKLFLEVFNEYYHIQLVHKKTFNDLYDVPDAPEPVGGQFVTQFGTHGREGSVASLDDGCVLPPLPGLSGRQLYGTRYSWIFPAMAFAASLDCAWSLEAEPITPGLTRCTTTVMLPPESLKDLDAEASLQSVYKRMDDSMDEDIIALERQQAGLESPLARAGRFSPTHEPNVHAFQRWWTDRLNARSETAA